MDENKTLVCNTVSPDERLARIVLSPRDIDPVTNKPKDSFISLRNQENGISFLRLDYMGIDSFLQSAANRADLYNKSLKKPKYAFVGWMESSAGDIMSLSPKHITIVVNAPDERPEHVNICFTKDGEVVKGIVTDAEVLDLMDELYHLLKYVTVE